MLKSLIKGHVAPLLTEAGFRKRDLTWNRVLPGLVHVLDVQRGRGKTGGGVDFTLNLGVWIESVWQLCWGKDSPGFIKEQDCFPRFRIGLVLANFDPMCRDKWWAISTDEDVQATGKDLEDVVRSHCMPLFDRLDSVAAVAQFVDTKVKVQLPLEKLYLAALRHLAGRGGATHLIVPLVRDQAWGEMARRLESRLEKLGGSDAP